jgi:Uma2 family endonuclease
MQVEVWTNLPDVDTTRVRRLRRSEYDRLVELGVFEGERVELIRGVIVRMPPQGAPHAAPIELLTELLVPALVGRARVRVQLPLIAPDDSEPEPDLAVVAREDHDREHPSAAHLVIEVARSSLAYDRGTKAPLYAAMGVPELWIVDVDGRVVEVHRSPRGDRFEDTSVVGVGASIALASFPDVQIEVAALFP